MNIALKNYTPPFSWIAVNPGGHQPGKQPAYKVPCDNEQGQRELILAKKDLLLKKKKQHKPQIPCILIQGKKITQKLQEETSDFK